jgi:hypothetical protein
MEDDNAESKPSKLGPLEPPTASHPVDDDLYQSGCGSTDPVVCLYFLAHRVALPDAMANGMYAG